MQRFEEYDARGTTELRWQTHRLWNNMEEADIPEEQRPSKISGALDISVQEVKEFLGLEKKKRNTVVDDLYRN